MEGSNRKRERMKERKRERDIEKNCVWERDRER